MKTCLITGQSGFIGQNLAKVLQQHNINPVAYPREFYERPGDNAQAITEFLFTYKPNYVVHLAAGGNLATQHEQDAEVKVNVINFYNFLNTIGYINFDILINFSSSSVTLPEQTLYSSTKKCAEALLESYPKPSVTVRPYSVTGVGEQKIHLIPTLIDAAFTGREIPFVSWPKHDFIDVEDVCRAVLHIMENHKMCKGLVIPVGTGIQFSNNEVKYMVEAMSGRDIKIKKTEEMRSYDTTDWKANTHILKSIGFSPKWSLEQTIKKMIDAYDH